MPQLIVQLLLLGTVAHISTAEIPGFLGEFNSLKLSNSLYQFSDDIPKQPDDASIPDARFVRSTAGDYSIDSMPKKNGDMKDIAEEMRNKGKEMMKKSRFVRSPADSMDNMKKKSDDMKDQGMDMKDKASEMSKKFRKSRFVRSSPPFSIDEIIKKAYEIKDKAMEMKNIATGMSGSPRNENRRFARSVGNDAEIILANFLSPKRERREARGSGGKMPTKQG